MIRDDRDQLRWKSNRTPASRRFWWPEYDAAVRQVNGLLLDGDRSVQEVNPLPAQPCKLTEAKRTVRAEQHHRLVLRIDRLRELRHLVGHCDRSLGSLLTSGSLDVAWVHFDPPVLDGGVEHRSSEAIRLAW